MLDVVVVEVLLVSVVVVDELVIASSTGVSPLLVVDVQSDQARESYVMVGASELLEVTTASTRGPVGVRALEPLGRRRTRFGPACRSSVIAILTSWKPSVGEIIWAGLRQRQRSHQNCDRREVHFRSCQCSSLSGNRFVVSW